MAASDITAEVLRQYVNYDPETGSFTNARDRKNGSQVGAPIGTIDRGHRTIMVSGVRRDAATWAWLYIHGEWPSGQIVHANADTLDVRLNNLQLVPRQVKTDRQSIDANRVRELLDYDDRSGAMRWKIPTRSSVGAIAGQTNPKNGYVYIGLGGHRYFAHRLAWLHFYGAWPNSEIDHKNGRRSDNRIENLRVVTHSENGQNKKKAQSNNATGMLGVARHRDKFQASIFAGGRHRYLGVFETPEEAHAAYLEAKKQLHPAAML